MEELTPVDGGVSAGIPAGPDEAPWLRRVSVWRPGSAPTVGSNDTGAEGPGFPWIELACGAERCGDVFATLSSICPGLSAEMLADLLTPDEAPAGDSFDDGNIRLASTFAVEAIRREKTVRGQAVGAGVLRFQPVELLAGPSWLISCSHPRRTFQGAMQIDEEAPAMADEMFRGVSGQWRNGRGTSPGDLGVLVMHELALGYAPAHRALFAWLEDWELSLYVEDELENQDELPELWGLMAVLRDWLNSLNRPGLRADLSRAWLPATDHEKVVAVDERVDRALEGLSRLSDTLRQSFGLLHLEQTEEQRRHSERMQHRIEVGAAAFLVPTLIVGFYGANTWIPGQGSHWGFWVMVFALVVLSATALLVVLRLQRRSQEAAKKASLERRQMRTELLRGR